MVKKKPLAMQLARFFFVVVVILGRICSSKILHKTNKLDGYAELEDAAIKMLSNCYGDEDKTMVLAGTTPGTLVKKLSSQRSHSIVLLKDHPDLDLELWRKHNRYAMHKVHIFVVMASGFQSLQCEILAFSNSKYVGTPVFVLVIGWSPEKPYGPCNRESEILTTLSLASAHEFTDTNIICRDIKGIVIYGLNPFTNYAPKPWRLVPTKRRHAWFPYPRGFSVFVREYRENEKMCENLFFEKLHNMHGAPLEVMKYCYKRPCREIIRKTELRFIDAEIYGGFIRDFVLYVNATEKRTWQNAIAGKKIQYASAGILAVPISLRGMAWYGTRTYPFTHECIFLITRYRGNKSQTQKIYDVLDGYSWGGMVGVYFITLIFFKYFLHQPLTVGILNLWRLTCSLGLTELPPNVPPRIYLGTLLFFMITMQGIFTSSLASVMTHDIPVRQVNTIQDIIDFNYTVCAHASNFQDFRNAGFKGRFIDRPPNVSCFKYVQRVDDLVACVTDSYSMRSDAMDVGFYISRGCINHEYGVMHVPYRWAFQNIFDKYVHVKMAGGFMTNFDVLVRLKKILEKELEEKTVPPKIMILTDLVFAFSFFAIGLGCACVSFIVEVMIPIYQKKARDHPKFSWLRRCVR